MTIYIMKINGSMKINSIIQIIRRINSSIWVIGISGIVVAVACFVFGHDGWATFNKAENVIGYIADLAIAVAIYNFFASETIDVKGIGKIRIRRRHNNIQDLTNIISWKKFGGDMFQRNKLLSAFYKDSPVGIEDDTEEKIAIDGRFLKNSREPEEKRRDHVLLRTNFSNIKSLMEAVKWIWNDGEPLPNDLKAELYTQWYKVNQHSLEKETTFRLDYNDATFTIDRRDFRTVDELMTVAECVLNGGTPFDKATHSEIYRKWYRVG